MYFQNLPVATIEAANPHRFDLEVFWQLWTRRQFPYNQLTVGDRVVLTETEPKKTGGLGSSLLRWLAEVDDVVKERYGSLSEAADIVKHNFGVRRAEFLGHPYTVGKPAEGVLLAWSARPLTALNMVRPPEVRFQRQGWAKLDDHLAHQILGLPPMARGRRVTKKGTMRAGAHAR